MERKRRDPSTEFSRDCCGNAKRVGQDLFAVVVVVDSFSNGKSPRGVTVEEDKKPRISPRREESSRDIERRTAKADRSEEIRLGLSRDQRANITITHVTPVRGVRTQTLPTGNEYLVTKLACSAPGHRRMGKLRAHQTKGGQGHRMPHMRLCCCTHALHAFARASISALLQAPAFRYWPSHALQRGATFRLPPVGHMNTRARKGGWRES